MGSRFVQALNLALEDVGVSTSEHDALFEIIEDSFSHIIRLSSSVTQGKGPAQSLLSNYVDNLHKKLMAVAEVNVMADDNVSPSKQQLFAAEKKTLEKVSDIYASALASFNSKRGLTYHSAHLLISFVLRVLSPEKLITLETNPALNLQLCQVANQLFNPSYNNHFLHDCQILFSFIEHAPNFDRESLTKALCAETSYHHSRLYILSLIYLTGKGCDAELRKYLVEQNEKLVFNDKNKDAVNFATLFEPFYKQIDEKVYLSEMHSNTQFCVNRSGILIPNIRHMVSNFGFKLSTESASVLSYELVTEDQIQNCAQDVQNLFETVCKNALDTSAFKDKVMGHMLKEFNQVKEKTTVTPLEKMRILQLACVCTNALEVSNDELVEAVLDLVFSTKEALEVSKEVRAFIKRSGDKAAEFISAGASKIQYSQ